MKTLSRFFAITAIAMIGLVACKKDNGGSTPTVTLEQKAVTYNSVTFTLTPSNAQKVAYVLVNEGEEVPSAKQIIESGKQAIADRAMDYIEKDLETQKSYKIAAAALSGNSYSEVASIDFTTVERTGFYLNVEISNVTDRSVDIKVTPTEDKTYVCVYYPRNMFPADMTTAEIANEYLKAQKGYLDQGMGLSHGVTNMTNLRCAYGTEYMVLYFGYSGGGVGMTCPAEIKLFNTKDAEIAPEALTIDIKSETIEARSAKFELETNCEVIHYFAGIVEKSKYSKDAIKNEVEGQIQQAYASQQATGLASVIELLEGANFYGLPVYKGTQTLELIGLKDKTEYVLVTFSLNLEGKVASEVYEHPFTTKEVNYSAAIFRPRENDGYIGLFRGDDIDKFFGGKYPSLTNKPTVIVVPEVIDADTNELYYYLAGGDHSEEKNLMVPADPDDPESGMIESDEIDPTTTDEYLIELFKAVWSKAYKPSGEENDIIMIPETSFNGWVSMPDLELPATLLMWAKDKDGKPGKMYRKLITATFDTSKTDLIGNYFTLKSALKALGYDEAAAEKYMSVFYSIN